MRGSDQQGRAGQGRRSASGRSKAKKSAQVPTRLTLQIWADLPRQRTPELRAATSLPPLTGSALTACSAPRRSLCYRRCHPGRPPPPELQIEPSRAEPSPAEAAAERLRAWPRLQRVGPTEPRPWPCRDQRRGVQDTSRRVPARLGSKSQWESGEGAELC